MSRSRNASLSLLWLGLVLAMAHGPCGVTAWAPARPRDSKPMSLALVSRLHLLSQDFRTRTVLLSGNGDGEDTTTLVPSLSESDQGIVGAVGTLASLIVLYSEFTLKTTGCGLPAGPLGLLGLAEGLSYLSVTGLVAYSLVTKVKTGSGLAAGPGGLLGAAEGLSFLAVVVGLVVLALQITNYGYIPNAIPMEGGMCS